LTRFLADYNIPAVELACEHVIMHDINVESAFPILGVTFLWVTRPGMSCCGVLCALLSVFLWFGELRSLVLPDMGPLRNQCTDFILQNFPKVICPFD
jgi:hypothetical protein